MFKEIFEIKKSFDKEDLNKEKRLIKQGIKVLLFTGRFQPFHLAHKLIAENGLKKSGASKLVIGIVKGEKSSNDKTKNPLDFNFQKSLILRCLPQAEIIELKNSFIPNVALDLREKGYEVIGIVSGDDRKKEYNTQFKTFDNIKNNNPKFVTPEIKSYSIKRKSKLTQNISATNIRKAISEGNKKEFKKMMPKELWEYFDTLKKNIK